MVTVAVPAPVAAQRAPQTPAQQQWWDEDPVAAQRARDLLARMTLEEKVDMMTGELNNYYGFFNAAIPRLGIPALTMADGPTGVRIANPNVNGQRATQFPAADARAATFSTDIEQQVGNLQGDEAFNTGHNVMLAPSVDIARHPQAGRLAEAYTEDPLLSGAMGAAYIRGVQGHPVMATIKHFNAYNQETNRFTGNAQVGERALQEIYTRPYDVGIRQGRPGAAMCAFNRVNGVFACENEIMQVILKEQLRFAGWIMSDYGATPSTVRAANAGLDQEQPGGAQFGTRLLEAVRAGQVSEARINDAVLRILRPMFALGLFDRPVGSTHCRNVSMANRAGRSPNKAWCC
jgi:beta-glucosidase